MDWEKESSGDFITYPAGTYHVRITSWERLSASTGTEQIRWRAEIIAPDEFKGRSILDHTALSEAALWRVARAVAACGIKATGKMDTSSPQFEAILTACKERRLFWHVNEEMYKGKVRNKVVDYQPDPDMEPVNLNNEDDIKWDE